MTNLTPADEGAEVVPTNSRPLASSVIACVKLIALPAVPEAAVNQA
jgi:hypothetical protein